MYKLDNENKTNNDNSINSNNNKHLSLGLLKNKSFIFTKGFLEHNLVFYEFKDLKDIETNYNYTLFKIVPSGSYDVKEKLIKSLSKLNSMLHTSYNLKGNSTDVINFKNENDLFVKYKQEIISNQTNYNNYIINNIPLRFEDNIHLQHITTGKFLCFYKDPKDLNTYLRLIDQPTKNTIFRVKSGYNYQTETGNIVTYNMSISIACGDNIANKEKFFGNSKFQLNELNYISNNTYLSNKNKAFNLNAKKKDSSINNVFPKKVKRNKSSVAILRSKYYNIQDNIFKGINKTTSKLIAKINNFLKTDNTISNKIPATSKSNIKISKKLNKFYDNYSICPKINNVKTNSSHSSNRNNSLINYYKNEHYLSSDKKQNNFNLDNYSSNRSFEDENLSENYTENNIEYYIKLPRDIAVKKLKEKLLKKSKINDNSVICDEKSYNKWKFLKYCSNIDNDDICLSTSDLFWIQNCEKDVYITANNNLIQEDSVYYYKKQNSYKKDINYKYKNNLFDIRNIIKNNPIISIDNLFLESNYYNRINNLVTVECINQLYKNNPFGLFKFEPVYIKSNSSQEDNNIIINNTYKIDNPPVNNPFTYRTFYKIKNVLTDSLLKVENYNNTKVLVLSSNINNYKDFNQNIGKYLFLIEPIVDNNESTRVVRKKSNSIYKLDLIRLKSKEYNLYLALNNTVKNGEESKHNFIEINNSKDNNNNKYIQNTDSRYLELTLTSNLSDLTIFKLDILSNKDIINMHQFKNINLIINYYINYFSSTKEIFDCSYNNNTKLTSKLNLNSNLNNESILINSLINIEDTAINNKNTLKQDEYNKKTFTKKNKLNQNVKINNQIMNINSSSINSIIKLSNEAIHLEKLLLLLNNVYKIISDYKLSNLDSPENNIYTNDNVKFCANNNNKLDCIKNIKELKIIQKLFYLFLVLWFKLPVNSFRECFNENNKMHDIKSKYFKNDYTKLLDYNENNAINKKANYYLENIEFKIECTNSIFNIFLLCFNLDPSIILPLNNSIHHLFKFIGKIDSCTMFLIHYLKNNTSLLMMLFSNYNCNKNYSNNYLNSSSFIINQFNEIINDSQIMYSSSQKSLQIFYELLNVFLICKEEPFLPFYENIVIRLNVINNDVCNNKILDYNTNMWPIVKFTIEDNKIFFVKRFFIVDSLNATLEDQKNSEGKENSFEQEKDIENCNIKEVSNNEITSICLSDNEYIANNNCIIENSNSLLSNFRLKENKTSNKKHTNNLYSLDKYSDKLYKDIKVEINFSNYQTEILVNNLSNNKANIAKEKLQDIVAYNIIFYSNLSLHNEEIRKELSKIFKFEIVNKYLTNDYVEITETEENLCTNNSGKYNNNTSCFYITEEIKCSLIRIINYLYLKKLPVNLDYYNLCRILTPDIIDKRYSIIKNIDILDSNNSTNLSYNDKCIYLRNNQDINIIDIINYDILVIINNIEKILISHIKGEKILSLNLLDKLTETCLFIVKYVYSKQIENCKHYAINKSVIYKYLSLLLIVFESLTKSTTITNDNFKDSFYKMLNTNISIENNLLINNTKFKDGIKNSVVSSANNNQLLIFYDCFSLMQRKFLNVCYSLDININKLYRNKLFASSESKNKINYQVDNSNMISNNYISMKELKKTSLDKQSSSESSLDSSYDEDNSKNNISNTDINNNYESIYIPEELFDIEINELSKELIKKICNIFLEFLNIVEIDNITKIENSIIDIYIKTVKENEINKDNDDNNYNILDKLILFSNTNKNELIYNGSNYKEFCEFIVNDIFNFNKEEMENKYNDKLNVTSTSSSLCEKNLYFNILNELSKYIDDIKNRVISINYFKSYENKKSKNFSFNILDYTYFIKNNSNTYKNYLSLYSLFFNSLNTLETNDLRLKVFDIIYKMSNQKKIFFNNVSNLIILTESYEIQIFETLKNYLSEYSFLLHSFNSIPSNDYGLLKIINKINKIIKNIKNSIFSNLFTQYLDIDYLEDNNTLIYDSIILINENNIPVKNSNNLKINKLEEYNDLSQKSKEYDSFNNSLIKNSYNKILVDNSVDNNIDNPLYNNIENISINDRKIADLDTIFNNTNTIEINDSKLKSNQINTTSNTNTYINNICLDKKKKKKHLKFLQSMLKNMNFFNLMIEYIKKLNNINNNIYKNEYKSKDDKIIQNELQNGLKYVLKLLSIYIKKNNEIKISIEENLEIVLNVLIISNYKEVSSDLKYWISYFLLEYLRNINISMLNNPDKLILIMSNFIKNIDWKQELNLIAFWTEIVKVILKSKLIENDEKFIITLDNIKKCLIDLLDKRKLNQTENISLREIIRLIIYLKNLNINDYENKIKFIFPVKEVITIIEQFFKQDNINNIPFDLINLSIEYLYDNSCLYKHDLGSNKMYINKFEQFISCIFKKIKNIMRNNNIEYKKYYTYRSNKNNISIDNKNKNNIYNNEYINIIDFESKENIKDSNQQESILTNFDINSEFANKNVTNSNALNNKFKINLSNLNNEIKITTNKKNKKSNKINYKLENNNIDSILNINVFICISILKLYKIVNDALQYNSIKKGIKENLLNIVLLSNEFYKSIYNKRTEFENTEDYLYYIKYNTIIGLLHTKDFNFLSNFNNTGFVDFNNILLYINSKYNSNKTINICSYLLNYNKKDIQSNYSNVYKAVNKYNEKKEAIDLNKDYYKNNKFNKEHKKLDVFKLWSKLSYILNASKYYDKEFALNFNNNENNINTLNKKLPQIQLFEIINNYIAIERLEFVESIFVYADLNIKEKKLIHHIEKLNVNKYLIYNELSNSNIIPDINDNNKNLRKKRTIYSKRNSINIFTTEGSKFKRTKTKSLFEIKLDELIEKERNCTLDKIAKERGVSDLSRSKTIFSYFNNKNININNKKNLKNKKSNIKNSDIFKICNLSLTDNKEKLFLVYSIINKINNIFILLVDVNKKYKEQLIFYLCIIIKSLYFNNNTMKFENSPLSQNKESMSDIRYTSLFLKVLQNKNLKFADYNTSLIVKFLNVYLESLEENARHNFYEVLILNYNSEYFFIMMKHTIDLIKNKLSYNNYSNYPKTYNDARINLQDREINLNNNYEIKINLPAEMLDFISSLLDNNKISGNIVKDYLRFQYNNNKSHNFIISIANIIEFSILFLDANTNNTIKDNIELTDEKLESKLNLDNNTTKINYKLSKYFSLLIKSIEILTKSCQGPCLDNQSIIINETNILNVVTIVLFKLTYKKKNNINNTSSFILTSCCDIGIKKKQLSLLKYKVLLLLLSLTEGRKKGDTIYNKIAFKFDYAKLSDLLIETLSEIMIENSVNNLNDLIIEDTTLYRYECFEQLNDVKFIIFEIGTFAYIILNIYYDNMKDQLKEDTFISELAEIKNILNFKKKLIKKKHIFTNIFEFYKLMYIVILDLVKKLYCLIMFFFKCLNNVFKKDDKKALYVESIKTNNIDHNITFEESYQYFFIYTPKLEVVFCNQLISYYVKLSPMCHYISSEIKDSFEENVDRTSTKSKLNYLFAKVLYYLEALEYAKKRKDFYKKIPLLQIFFDQYYFWKDTCLITTLFINIIILLSYYQIDSPSDKIGYSLMFNENYSYYTILLFKYLSIFHLTTSFIALITYLIQNFAKYTWIDIKKKDICYEIVTYRKKSYSSVKLIILFLSRLLTDKEFLYNILNVVFGFLGILIDYFFFSYHLLELVIRLGTLKNVILSIWKPKKQIVVTLMLFIIIEYYFTIFIFLFYPDDVEAKLCYRMDTCLITIFDHTFKVNILHN